MAPSSRLLSKVWYAWHFAKNAYRPDETGYRGDEWLKGELKAEALQVIKRGNMTCFAAEQGDRLIISFAGSNDITDWMRNVRSIGSEKYQDSFVGEGFLENYRLVSNELVDICADTKKKICIYGHSAGGAAAFLHADKLSREPIRWHEIITFESPRVFSRHLASKFDGELYGRTCLRVTHGTDFVPHVPVGLRFSHVGNELWFPRQAIKRAELNPSILRRAWQTLRAIRIVSSGLDHTCDRINNRLAVERCILERES